MAIGTLAGIGLAAAGVGQVLGGRSASSGTRSAADTAAATARENNAFLGGIHNQNQQTLNPFIQGGTAAGGQLNALLGVSSGPNWNQYLAANPDVQAEYYAAGTDRTKYTSPEAYAQFHYGTYGQQEGRALPTNNQQTAQQGFADYIGNSDYAFQQQQGGNALNSGYAGAGTLQSGAAMKDLERFRQNLQSGYRNEYMNALSGQQNVGLGAASALAGLGQNYGAMVSNNNNSAGSAAANAALIRGQNNPFANALSTLGGGILGYA